MKTRVYSIHKAKNVFAVVFQITCFSVCKNIIVYLVYVFFFLKADKWATGLELKKKVLCVV